MELLRADEDVAGMEFGPRAVEDADLEGPLQHRERAVHLAVGDGSHGARVDTDDHVAQAGQGLDGKVVEDAPSAYQRPSISIA